jgi:hypothetical protein
MTGYCRHYGCLWLLVLLGWTVTLGVLLAAWLAWAAVILPLAGISWAARNPALAGRLVRSLKWDLGALVGQ